MENATPLPGDAVSIPIRSLSPRKPVPIIVPRRPAGVKELP